MVKQISMNSGLKPTAVLFFCSIDIRVKYRDFIYFYVIGFTMEDSMTIYDFFKGIKDFRRAEGKVHKLEMILLILTMSIMSDYIGIRATGDFIKRNRKELLDLFKPKGNKLPSFQTISRVLSGLDFNELNNVFMSWSKSKIGDNNLYSIDGKGISGTLKNSQNNLQEYSNLVSVFNSKNKQVLGMRKVDNKSNEIPCVQILIKDLGLEGVIFTLDALHCQKETLKAIKESDNDYIIGVKGNQKNLLETVKKNLR
jgi:hypothetical protein